MEERIDPEIALAIAYAPADARRSLSAVWALDSRLAGVVRSTGEPMIGMMRLTWWRDRLEALGDGAPAEPVLAELHAAGVPALDAVPEGWMALLEPMPLDDVTLQDYAEGRGGGLFGACAAVLGARDERALRAGAGWALADFAFACSNRETAVRAIGVARPLLDEAASWRWPRALRPLGMLVRLARADVAAGLEAPRRKGSPKRMLLMLRHRLTGR